MLHSYLKTAFRNLLRNKRHFLVNITGLLVGFGAFLLISIVVQYVKEYDNFHTKKDRIYRLVRADLSGNGFGTGAPFPFAEGLRTDYPQLEKVAGIYGDKNVQVIIPGKDDVAVKKFSEATGVFFAEPSFFEMFDFKMLAGNAVTGIQEQNTALLSREVANRYFGDWQQATGKMIRAYGRYIRITGVMENPPDNTDFALGIVISYATLKPMGVGMNDWVGISNNYVMVMAKEGYTADQLSSLLPGFIAKHIPPSHAGYKLLLQPLKDIHTDKRFETFSGRVFSKELINALHLTGIFLLIIACVNFVNLSTANAINRAREVGVRKVLGSNRQQLLLQFLGETGLSCLLAMTGALILAIALLPALNKLLEMKISLSVLPVIPAVLFILFLWAIVTVSAGFYPALVLSGFNPMNALKSRLNAENPRGLHLRRGLVTFQFVIAQILIIGTLIVIAQTNYFRNADMGFNKEAIITAEFPHDSVSRSRFDYLRDELMRQQGVRDVSFSLFAPAGEDFWATDFKLGSNHTDKADLIVNMKPADTNYFNIYKMQLLAGRVYYDADTVREFVVNETLVKKAGFASPEAAIGQPITVMNKTLPIVGVVKDFHVKSLRDPIDPVVMTTVKRIYKTANIRIEPGKAKTTIAALETLWNKYYPDYIFKYSFMDQTLAGYYKQENQLAQLFKIFAGIAIFISCLGLYGLISFMALRRKKEIGIRKVLGADVLTIVMLMSREFTLLITLAFVIATPLAWYFMNDWLQQFSFRMEIGAGVFVITLLFSLVIAWLTVGHSAIKAALADPVKSLRTE
ncbi:ABC transporter permease [Chitinophaga pinensis]|uniref:FtsX-like permease family protein n=1 Tax=Chitinophaga pinensis TaxID=79329 RepID=A0A5C6LYK0_9BACT|nr:ABC transporter permease [Chitinophaga pinensis]TWW00719.1 FtsX-like permease family protein [Chitinophaga pinensis]